MNTQTFHQLPSVAAATSRCLRPLQRTPAPVFAAFAALLFLVWNLLSPISDIRPPASDKSLGLYALCLMPPPCLPLLAAPANQCYPMSDELDRPSDRVASPSSAGETPAPVGSDSVRCRPKHGLRAGAGGPIDAAERARADRTTRYLDTSRGILSYSEVAPLTSVACLLVTPACLAVSARRWEPLRA